MCSTQVIGVHMHMGSRSLLLNTEGPEGKADGSGVEQPGPAKEEESY